MQAFIKPYNLLQTWSKVDVKEVIYNIPKIKILTSDNQWKPPFWIFNN